MQPPHDTESIDADFEGVNFLTPFDPHDARYQVPFKWTIGPNKESKRWCHDEKTTNVAMKFRRLARHQESKSKDGLAFVLGEMAPGQRLKTAVKALYAIALDFDKGTPPEKIDAAMKALGCACIRYTTYSNGKTREQFKRDEIVKWQGDDDSEIDTEVMRRFLIEKKGWDAGIVATVEYKGQVHDTRGMMVEVSFAPMPKNRVVIPLAEPFVIADIARTQSEAIQKWAKVPVAMAERMGLRDALDMTGTDTSRLFYYPRHAQNMPWEVAICGGPLFDWRSLELDNPYLAAAQEVEGKSKGGKSKTDAGRALASWSIKHAEGFQIASLLRDHCEDRIRGNGSTGVEIECPFDDGHGNPGDPDDRACQATNAGDSQAPVFSIKCQHASCRDYTNLDMLAKMLADGWFPKSVLEDEIYYDDDHKPATDNAAPGWTDESIIHADAEKTYEEMRERVGKLTKNSKIAESNAILSDMAAAVGLNDMYRDGLFNALVKRTGLGKTVLKASYARYASERRKEETSTGKKGESPSKPLIERLSVSLGKPFDLPTDELGSFDLEEFAGQIWMFRRPTTDEGEDRRLTTPFMLLGGINYADRGEDRGLRVVVRREDGTWCEREIDPGEIAEGGRSAMGSLRRAGLQMTRAGAEFVSHYLLESQPKAITVYHRAGFRDGAFVCPTGEVLLAPKGTVELAHDMRLKCAPRAGSLEGWRDGTRDLFELGVEKTGQFQSGILMGLTGALADLAGDDPLAYSLEGASTHGKSTTQEMAVAPWCNPSVKETQDPKTGIKGYGLFRPARGTANSLEGLMEVGSGTVAAYDEIGKLPAKDQQDLMFMNQAGSGKHRMKADGTMRKSRTWGGTALLVSAETGFAQRLRMENVAQLGGLSARLISLQVDTWPLLDKNREWPVVERVKANFGWSGPAFVEALDQQGFVRDPDKLRTLVGDSVSELPNLNEGNTAFRRRVARPVGYLWGAGKIAADAGLIPVTADLDGLMQRIWKDVLASEIGPTDAKTRAVIHLLDQITALKGSSVVNINDREEGHRELVGYWGDIIPDPDDPRVPCPVYVLRNDKLGELSGGFADAGALRKELEAQGILLRSKDGKSRTWSGYRGLGKGVQYVVLRASGIDA